MASNANSVMNGLVKQLQATEAANLKPRAASKTWYSAGVGGSSGKSHKVAYVGGANKVVNPTTSKGSTKDGGILGSITKVAGNLGGDVADMVQGIPGGIMATIHHPIATGEAVAHDYRTRYGPLFGYLNGGGDIGKFAKQAAAHPLAPILDLASVATAGGALAAKVGQTGRVAELASRAGAEGTGSDAAMAALRRAAPKRMALYDATKGGYREIAATKTGEKGVKVVLPNNPVTRLRRNLGITIQEKVLPTNLPLIGLHARALKGAANELLVQKERTRYAQRGVEKAVTHLEKTAGGDSAKLNSMATAADYLVSGVDPLMHAETIKAARSDPAFIEQQMTKHGHTPEQIQAATDHALRPALDPVAKSLFDAAQHKMQLDSIQRTGMHIPASQMKKADLGLVHSPEVAAIIKLRDAHDVAATDTMRQLVKAGKMTADQVSKRRVLHVAIVDAVHDTSPRTIVPAIISKSGVGHTIQKNVAAAATSKAAREAAAREARLTPEQIDKGFHDAGLPAPVYNPDTISVGSKGLKAGGDTGNYATGDRVVAPLNIHMRNEWASKITDAHHAHSLLVSLATKMDRLPNNNWVWIRDNIPKTAQFSRDLGASQAEHGMAATKDFYKALRDETRPTGGLAVPRQMFNEMTLGRAGMTAARHTAVTHALNIWKWMTLATRPGFATVNILSNQLMYHLKNGWNLLVGKHAKQAAGAFDEHHAAEGLTWGDSEKFGKEKSPSKLQRAANILYTIVGSHEHLLRKYTMYETARKLPQFQRELNGLKATAYDPAAHGGRTMWHEAYNRMVAKHPYTRDMVTKNMDDTLGNYRYYTQGEQALKNLSPFYGWQRHSTRNMIRMFEDNPATMAMLNQEGIQGNAKFNKDFGPGMPAFVKSYVMDSYIKTVASALGLGPGVNSYDFGPINPWKTGTDVGQALLRGNRDAIIGSLGPAITGPLEEWTGKNPLTGAPAVKTHFSNPFLSIAERVLHQTPPVTLGEDLGTNKLSHKKMLLETKPAAIARFAGAGFRAPVLDKLRAMEKRKQTAAATAAAGHKVNPFAGAKRKSRKSNVPKFQ